MTGLLVALLLLICKGFTSLSLVVYHQHHRHHHHHRGVLFVFAKRKRKRSWLLIGFPFSFVHGSIYISCGFHLFSGLVPGTLFTSVMSSCLWGLCFYSSILLCL